MISSSRRLLGFVSATCAMGAAAFAAMPAAAQASLINLKPCNTSALSQPFAPWGDNASYELAPGGDFESSGWNLSGSASVVPGSEPFAATGTLGQYSLSVPAGSSATSPLTCVDAAYPTVRLFVGGTGTAAVSVVYDGIPIPAGLAIGGGTWTPSLPMVTQAAILGALSGGSAQVSIQVTALTGDPQIDDVFIDPWRGGG